MSLNLASYHWIVPSAETLPGQSHASVAANIAQQAVPVNQTDAGFADRAVWRWAFMTPAIIVSSQCTNAF
jgi:hypothetical protein